MYKVISKAFIETKLWMSTAIGGPVYWLQGVRVLGNIGLGSCI